MRRIIGGLLLRGLRVDVSNDIRSESQRYRFLLQVGDLRTLQDYLSSLLRTYTREIFSKVSTIPKRFLSSSDTTALPGLSTTKDFMPAAIAASTSLTLSLRNRIDSDAS